MITEIGQEFERIAGVISATYVNKNVNELQQFAQSYNFDQPLVNWVPVMELTPTVNISGGMDYPIDCVLQFLTIADRTDNLEQSKDSLNDEMLTLCQRFFLNLNKNDGFIFLNKNWRLRVSVFRPFFTSNFLVGVEAKVTLETSCNRI